MSNSICRLTAAVIVILMMAGCGHDTSLQEELQMVPGLCFVHAHLSENIDTDLFPDELESLFPLWLCDSLLSKGDLGISLLSINLSDLTPQLLFLSAGVKVDEMVMICMNGFSCNSEETGNRVNLISEQGSVLGSISSRNGWTCLITGSGSDRAVERWLVLEETETLASDPDLLQVSSLDSKADFTLLVSHNTISFLSVIPDGMMTRSDRRFLNRVRNLIYSVDPKALRISLDFTDDQPFSTILEFEIIRGNNDISNLRIDFSDTGISPDSLIHLILREL